MRKKASKPVALILSVIMLILASTYAFQKIRVDDMPGFVVGRNWKFIPESKLPKCIPDPSTFGHVHYLNEVCYTSGDDVFF